MKGTPDIDFGFISLMCKIKIIQNERVPIFFGSAYINNFTFKCLIVICLVQHFDSRMSKINETCSGANSNF